MREREGEDGILHHLILLSKPCTNVKAGNCDAEVLQTHIKWCEVDKQDCLKEELQVRLSAFRQGVVSTGKGVSESWVAGLGLLCWSRLAPASGQRVAPDQQCWTSKQDRADNQNVA
jgi:hypothetical protein